MNTVRCFVVVAVVVGVTVGVVGLWMIVMLNNQAYTFMKPMPCHRVIERADQFQML